MADPLMKRAAPQFISKSLSLKTPEARLADLMEIYGLLYDDERAMLFDALVSRLVDAKQREREAAEPFPATHSDVYSLLEEDERTYMFQTVARTLCYLGR